MFIQLGRLLQEYIQRWRVVSCIPPKLLKNYTKIEEVMRRISEELDARTAALDAREEAVRATEKTARIDVDLTATCEEVKAATSLIPMAIERIDNRLQYYVDVSHNDHPTRSRLLYACLVVLLVLVGGTGVTAWVQWHENKTLRQATIDSGQNNELAVKQRFEIRSLKDQVTRLQEGILDKIDPKPIINSLVQLTTAVRNNGSGSVDQRAMDAVRKQLDALVTTLAAIQKQNDNKATIGATGDQSTATDAVAKERREYVDCMTQTQKPKSRC